MHMTLEELRNVVREVLAEVKRPKKPIGPGVAYMKKEAVREKLQAVVLESVEGGEVSSPAELDELFVTMDMALGALRMVPFEAYQKLSKG
jgi:hypothetical protein